MLGKVEAPIFILAFFYLAIIVLALVFCILVFLSSTGVFDYVNSQHLALMSRHCKIYSELQKTSAYQKCLDGVYLNR
ncbi:MAG: hypothetical protein PHT40_01760 [Patescibacteria group bacterium]|nr:hypothetical protein [Patescibacteria group bacterium]